MAQLSGLINIFGFGGKKGKTLISVFYRANNKKSGFQMEIQSFRIESVYISPQKMRGFSYLIYELSNWDFILLNKELVEWPSLIGWIQSQDQGEGGVLSPF